MQPWLCVAVNVESLLLRLGYLACVCMIRLFADHARKAAERGPAFVVWLKCEAACSRDTAFWLLTNPSPRRVGV